VWFPATVNVERRITRIAEAQHGTLTRNQALRAGLSRDVVDYRLAIGRWEVVHRGVYRIAGSKKDWLQGAMAATLAAGPGSATSHRTAGTLWGLLDPGTPYELSVCGSRRVKVPGLIVHRAPRLSEEEIRHVGILPVTSPAQTLIDLAAALSASDLEEVLDEALARRIVRLEHIRGQLQQLGGPGRRGAGVLKRLLEDRAAIRRHPHSRFETRLLRMLKARGLPPPKCQHRVELPSGRKVRVDFAYPEAMLAIEADSYRHHSSLTDWSRDHVRNNGLMSLGWRVLPVTHQDLTVRPALIADQIARLLVGTEVGAVVRPISGKVPEPRRKQGLR
jgi:very-short-patch-repair endonuclease